MWAAALGALRRGTASAALGCCGAHTSAAPPRVAVVGAGHNGLIAATLLARQGYEVDVFEDKDMVGGAAKTEYPFARAPGLGQSTGAPAARAWGCSIAGAGTRLTRGGGGGGPPGHHPPPPPPPAGAYLLGVMPPELLALLDVDLPLRRRDPH